MEDFKKLRDEWIFFLCSILNPLTLLMMVAIGIMIALQVVMQDNTPLFVLFSLIITVFGGVLGSSIVKKIDKLYGEQSLIARGHLAIRSLGLINVTIISLKKKINNYMNRIMPQHKDIDLQLVVLEEVINSCSLLEEYIISSIDNWSDIVPEIKEYSNQRFLQDQISQLMEESKVLAGEKDKLNEKLVITEKQLVEDNEKSEEEKNQLKETIENLKSEISLKEEENKVYKDEIDSKKKSLKKYVKKVGNEKKDFATLVSHPVSNQYLLKNFFKK